jgi:RNAse (barnase) inhibitor barstar
MVHKVMGKRVFEIDGNAFNSLEGFYDEVSRKVFDAPWGKNLDAFNDVLRGGFGTPDEGFVLRWRNSERSRSVLGYPATVRWLEKKLHDCHPSNVDHFQHRLEAARRGEGLTLFDTLVEIILAHGPGGGEEGDCVDLELA